MSPHRGLVVACAAVCAAMVCFALLAIAQLVSVYDWCERSLGSATAELRMGAQPAVLCRTSTDSLELNVTPAVVTVGLALAGLAIGIYAVAVAARRRA